MKSHMMQCGIYMTWMASASAEAIEHVDAVFALCELNYKAGGDYVVECYGPEDILAQFKTLDDVRRFCGLQNEAAANARWGEDTDPEVNKPAWRSA